MQFQWQSLTSRFEVGLFQGGNTSRLYSKIAKALDEVQL